METNLLIGLLAVVAVLGTVAPLALARSISDWIAAGPKPSEIEPLATRRRGPGIVSLEEILSRGTAAGPADRGIHARGHRSGDNEGDTSRVGASHGGGALRP